MLQHSKPFHGQHELSALVNEGNNNNEPVVVEEAEQTLDTRPATGVTRKINPLTMLRQAFRRKQWDLVNFYLGKGISLDDLPVRRRKAKQQLPRIKSITVHLEGPEVFF
ncbi:unnamed protein product [Oikopleura dioica]|uniref:Uncharacterized protein n=1 Tax=Oikopleura dioica TaxID=34765 RepID=E4X3G2_OIKDI|nr:unnamed protein product [Oikopleura dioica]